MCIKSSQFKNLILVPYGCVNYHIFAKSHHIQESNIIKDFYFFQDNNRKFVTYIPIS